MYYLEDIEDKGLLCSAAFRKPKVGGGGIGVDFSFPKEMGSQAGTLAAGRACTYANELHQRRETIPYPCASRSSVLD